MSGDITREVAAQLARLTVRLRGRGRAPEVVARALIGRVAGCFADALGVPARACEAAGLAAPVAEEFAAVPEWQALARLRWVDVDPAIFGALLEEALEPGERRRLGAHFTPRAYVERLMRVAVEEPLRVDWERVQVEARAATARGEPAAAMRAVREHLARIAAVRVLDPACGTGNFLIVAYESLKALEVEARALLGELGVHGDLPRVSLAQLVGIDCKPWACEIAGLVLWIAAIRWHVRVHGAAPPDVVAERAAIVEQDALLAGDGPAPWPESTFIVGNPPFLGKSRLQACLGGTYTRRLRAAYPEVPESADLVMYWWYRAATLLQAGAIRRFGLVTTNSVTQIYNRRVIEKFLAADPPIHLTCAIADHPWGEGPRGAQVRIAMTVAAAGRGGGRRLQMSPGGGVAEESGVIGADLRVGVEVASAARLRANQGLAGAGVMLGGRGFLVPPGDALRASGCVRPIVHGRDLLQRSRDAGVIDFSGLTQAEARAAAPEAFARLVATVKPQRAGNPRAPRRERFWQFSEMMPATRRAIAGLSRYIATPETAKHRVFCFVDGAVVPEHPLLAIGLDDAFFLAVLSSRVHASWARATGGTLEDRPRYNKSVCFETFPFPECERARRAEIAGLGERLEDCRRALRAEGWTVTAMYNTGLPALREVHAAIDRAVLAAYGLAEAAPERVVLAELLALNRRRAAEERAGAVRWLRPGWQGCLQGHVIKDAAKDR